MGSILYDLTPKATDARFNEGMRTLERDLMHFHLLARMPWKGNPGRALSELKTRYDQLSADRIKRYHACGYPSSSIPEGSDWETLVSSTQQKAPHYAKSVALHIVTGLAAVCLVLATWYASNHHPQTSNYPQDQYKKQQAEKKPSGFRSGMSYFK